MAVPSFYSPLRKSPRPTQLVGFSNLCSFSVCSTPCWPIFFLFPTPHGCTHHQSVALTNFFFRALTYFFYFAPSYSRKPPILVAIGSCGWRRSMGFTGWSFQLLVCPARFFDPTQHLGQVFPSIFVIYSRGSCRTHIDDFFPPLLCFFREAVPWPPIPSTHAFFHPPSSHRKFYFSPPRLILVALPRTVHPCNRLPSLVNLPGVLTLAGRPPNDFVLPHHGVKEPGDTIFPQRFPLALPSHWAYSIVSPPHGSEQTFGKVPIRVFCFLSAGTVLFCLDVVFEISTHPHSRRFYGSNTFENFY